jgi:probable F420-dependent oxidoreductase
VTRNIAADEADLHGGGSSMSEVGRFGVFLPSYIWEGDGPERARGIKAFSRAVEELGFDSLFITDHLLAAKRFYSVSFLEPLSALAVAAGVTERVRLGTSILIMPLRNPVMLAKELATLQFLSENRVILGAGVGWNDPEYEAVGVHKSERGKRTDEILDIVMPLLQGETVTYHGRYYSVDDLIIEPISSQRPEIWIGGGSQLADEKSPDLPRFVESVKARVLRTDGWIPRPTCPPDDIARDWVELQAYYRDHGRDPRDCVVAHENFLHLVMTNDPVKAREEQHRAFLKVMSSERGERYLESVYLFGTPDEVIASLQARVEAGVEYFVLHTMTPDPAQLRNWVDEIIPNVTFPATAGPVRRLASALR